MKMLLFSFAFCFLVKVHCEDAATGAAADHKTESSLTETYAQDVSRIKRATLNDMKRLGRGLQMLRLGKRQLNVLRLGRPAPSENEVTLEELVNSLENEDGYSGYYYPEDEYVPEESLHARKRRSAEASQEAVPSESVLTGPTKDVKRSVDGVQEPFSAQEGGEGDTELFEDGVDLEKRPMNMLRLGKRPMNMLRLGKRPMNMLRLGKRPMNMLRLGKRPMNMLRLGKRDGEEGTVDEEDFVEPEEEEEEETDFTVNKRPMNMLRLGKRPMNMLRLGKRPMNMLRLGKRPMNMLRLGKRPMNMLRLGKRDAQ